MTRQKDLKRIVRARMSKTGESYTTARARLLEKTRPAPAPTARDLARAGMSDDAVRAKTGRTWREWVDVLDAIGALEMRHADIARHLRAEHGLPSWWSQTVTVGYERIRGLRDVGQRRGGTYDVHRSRTLPVPLARLYRAFSSRAVRARWIGGAAPVVRTSRVAKSMRMTWPDGTDVQVVFTAKGPAKSQVAIQHGRLPGKSAAERVRAEWGARLDALAASLAPVSSKGEDAEARGR